MTENSRRHIVLGMAGHIDHGKTELVKALTGTDTDRLKEEKERGMTTDLGFAFLGEDITIIDVPGHEKFVKTMVAGVNTVDLALLVVAADDGVMPQTVEHLEILNLLNVPGGIIALTKADLAEQEWLVLVSGDIRRQVTGTVLETAPIIPVSSISGMNIDLLKETVLQKADEVRERRDTGVFRMPIDRVFTIKGFGTVVAGTVLSGTIRIEDRVELLPGQKTYRVRGLQVHDQSVESSAIGFRTAVNLQNADKDEIIRGHVLAEPGFFKPTYCMDARFTLLKSWGRELKNRTRVRAHVGTSEVMARIILLDQEKLDPGEEGLVQLRLERPVTADRGDRFVVRSYSPVRTLGGGTILEPRAEKHKRFQSDLISRLEGLRSGESTVIVQDFLLRCGFVPINADETAKALGLRIETVENDLGRLEEEGRAQRIGKKRWLANESTHILKSRIMQMLDDFFQKNPLRLSMSGAEIRSQMKRPVDRAFFDIVCQKLAGEGKIEVQGDRIKLKGRAIELQGEMAELSKDVESAFLADHMKPPRSKELIEKHGKAVDDIIQHLFEQGRLVRLEEGLFIHTNAVEKAKKIIADYIHKNGPSPVSDLKEALGTTRKYAVPLLAYLDGTGFTIREGDERRLKE